MHADTVARCTVLAGSCSGGRMALDLRLSRVQSPTARQFYSSLCLNQSSQETLNCTIQTETCEGELLVYWFRHGSGESRPGIIYTYGDRSDQCENSPEAGSPTQSYVYNLPKRNLSLSDAGTYYCAVASCGEILFGNWTKLDVECAASQSSEIHLVTANVGETVTLHDFYKGNLALYFMWYKQTMGDNPQLLSTFYKYNKNATFYHEFKDNTRFSVQSGKGMNHLKISDMQLSDSASYYCGNSYANQVEFGAGLILTVKGSRNMTVLQQPVSESVQPGDSVTLNCTIHTETCVGEHSVYWFRHDSGESRPGIIYTHGDRSDQCEKSPEAGSPTQSCVYNLPKRNLSLSDAGTYYCAVASCGEMLFGNGTKLDIQDEPEKVSAVQRISLSDMSSSLFYRCRGK
ncbi:uncharacterized protein [Salvelinus alpinus]|uniref:uncharacterized protein n=1 Tax=Salvelinus alpinus TaxID=8036 RepID=UPI0039FBBD2E